jgi:glycosyltransferase involved in cell wall biosynthesis
MKPPRVLHVVGGMNRNGIETWLMRVTRTVDRRDFTFDFLLHDADETAYERELTQLGCRVLRVPVPKRSVLYSRALEQCLRRERCDILHSHEHHTTGTILRAAARAGLTVRIAHSHNDSRPADARASLARRAFNAVNRRWLDRYAHAGFAASPHAASALYGESWHADPRWRVLSYGIDMAAFRQRVNAADTRDRLAIPRGARVIGHVGRFEEQKNHRFFVEIASALVQRVPSAHFLLIGDGTLRQDIRGQIDRAGLTRRFTLLRNRADVPELMLGAMDAFLFPSLYEGLGIVLIEAQAAGLPCIMSSAVPPEADVFRAANARLDLAHPVNEWVDAVTTALARGREFNINALESSPWSISRSTTALLTAYEGLLP